MFSLYLASSSGGALGSVDTLTTQTELLAAHGVFALLAFFLFYLWRRSLKDYRTAAEGDKERLWQEHRGVVQVTYALMAVAIPVWIFATFIYQPRTVLWGSVANLRQSSDDPKPGQVNVEQQIAPEQPGVKFYTHPHADTNGNPPVVTLEWALVEDGQDPQVPFLFRHIYKAWITPEVAPDPRTASVQPKLVKTVQDFRFVATLPRLPALSENAFDYRYYQDPADPDRNVGTIKLFRNGNPEEVKLQRVAALTSPAAGPASGLLAAWFRIPSVYAQEQATPHRLGPSADVYLTFLGSSNLDLQLQAQRALHDMLAQGNGWDSVRKAIDDPKSGPDHALLIHNLSFLVTNLRRTPADVKLKLARELYQAGDYKGAAALFNGLNDNDLGGDAANLYYRGVANLQTGDFHRASADLTKYLEKAPNAATKSVARQTLSVALEKEASKKRNPADTRGLE